MYQISNFTDNDDVKIISRLGAFQVIEYQRDLSITPSSAVTAFYSAQMNVKKRQLVCDLTVSYTHLIRTMAGRSWECPWGCIWGYWR